MALCQLLAKLRDKNGRVAIPGFYDDVEPLSAFERKQFARLPFNATAVPQSSSACQSCSANAVSRPIEQRTARPTFEINGLTSGYQGEGSKTIVPAWARAKITCRLVPNQKPAKIIKLVRAISEKASARRPCAWKSNPATARKPYLVSPTSAAGPGRLARLANSLRPRTGADARRRLDSHRQSNSRKSSRADTLLLGLALPDDNAHSPNEKFDLDCFAKGQLHERLLSGTNSAKPNELSPGLCRNSPPSDESLHDPVTGCRLGPIGCGKAGTGHPADSNPARKLNHRLDAQKQRQRLFRFLQDRRRACRQRFGCGPHIRWPHRPGSRQTKRDRRELDYPGCRCHRCRL